MKPHTQILDKTQKKGVKVNKWNGPPQDSYKLVLCRPTNGGGTSRVKQPYKQQKGWPF